MTGVQTCALPIFDVEAVLTDCVEFAAAVSPADALADAEPDVDVEADGAVLVAAAASLPPNIFDMIDPKILIPTSHVSTGIPRRSPDKPWSGRDICPVYAISRSTPTANATCLVLARALPSFP